MKNYYDHMEREVKKANIRLHELIADEYDSRDAVFHPQVRKETKKTISAYLENRNGLALDFCCGTGNIAEILMEKGFAVFGFDITKKMVSIAATKVPRAGFVVGDAFEPPFQAGIFSVVAISGALHHVIDYKTVLTKAVELLEPGGILLILNEPNSKGYKLFKPARKYTRLLLPEKRVKKHEKAGEITERQEKLAEYHLNHSDGIDPKDVGEALKAAGCRVIKIKYTSLNMMANMGERASVDVLGRAPLLAKVKTGKFSPDFHLIAEKLK